MVIYHIPWHISYIYRYVYYVEYACVNKTCQIHIDPDSDDLRFLISSRHLKKKQTCYPFPWDWHPVGLSQGEVSASPTLPDEEDTEEEAPKR